MKNKIFSLLLALVLLMDVVTAFPIKVFSVADDGSTAAAPAPEQTQDNTESYIEGMVKLSCEDSNPVSLAKGGKLYAFTTLDPSLGNDARYSWEVMIGEGRWATVSGYVFSFAVITEALLYNAATVDGAACLRCIVTVDDDKYVSDILKVILPASESKAAATETAEAGSAKEKSALAPLSARAMADAPNLLEGASSLFQIEINYAYRHKNPALDNLDGENAANVFTVTLPENTSYTGTVATPLEIGYLPYVRVDQAKYVTGAPKDEAELESYIQRNKIAYGDKTRPENEEEEDIDEYVLATSIQFDNQVDNITIDVYFIPQEVMYSVMVFEQNLYDDEYTLAETITMTGIANARIGEGLDTPRLGFSPLYYDSDLAISEDGSFAVEIYYDRIYYFVNFDLNDNNEAYGVTNHYARFKTTVVLPPPTRPGYAFLNWELKSVKNDPDDTEQVTEHPYPTNANGGYIINSVEHNLNYQAQWEAGTTSYTVIYWLENANDSGFTLDSFKTVTGVPLGDDAKASAVDDLSIPDASCFEFCEALSDKDVPISPDGTTAVNAYYLRRYYTMTFNGESVCITNDVVGHQHTEECNSADCGLEAHVHTEACGKDELLCEKEEHLHVGACCSLTEHVHDESCCSIPYHVHGTGANSDCEKVEHALHHDTCFSRNTLKEAASLTDNNQKNAYTSLQSKIAGPLNGYVYRIRIGWFNGTIYNFLYVHNQWFYLGTGTNYNGVTVPGISDPSIWDGSTASAAATAICGLEIHTHGDGNCTCPLTEHDHTSGCTCTIDRHVHGEGDCVYACGKEAHRHNINCYSHNCGKEAHTHNGDCKRTCQLIEHTCTADCQTKKTQNFLQFRAKYNADISKIWTKIEEHFTEGERWKDKDETYFGEVLVYVPFMPPADITFNEDVGTAKNIYTINYYLESLGEADKVYKTYSFDLNNSISAKYSYLTPDEDFFDIRGFKKFESDPAVSGGQIKDETDYEVSLYYLREEYKLEFVSLGTTLSTHTKVLKYQQPIGASLELMAKDIPYPSTKETGAIRFAGWYSTPNCADGTEFVFDGSTTMPEGGLVLYAKWETCSYTVNIYTDKSKTTLFDTQTVLFNSFIDEPNYLHIQHPGLGGDHPGTLPDHEHPGIDDENHNIFTGWYYLVDETPVRFDFNTMSVKFDMEIYAGWTTRTAVKYSVRYVYFNGEEYVDIAESIGGSSLAGITKTFKAKVGEDLHEDYRTNFFPDIRSHTMVMSANEDENVFLFVYSSLDTVKYTVTHNFVNEAFASILGVNSISLTIPHEIHGENIKTQAASVAVSFREGITKENIIQAVEEQYGDLSSENEEEIWAVITDMSPDYFIQDLILTTDSDQNNAIFKWTDEHGEALYQVIYYIESVDGTEYLIYNFPSVPQQIKVEDGTEIDAEQFGHIREIQHFEFDPDNPLNITSGTATATAVDPDTGTLKKGLVLKLHYKRKTYKYTVKYYREGTTQELADAVEGEAKYQQMVSIADIAKTIDGYTLTNGSSQVAKTASDDQEIICSYQGLSVNYRYQIIGVGGTIAEPTDTVSIGEGKPKAKTLVLWNDGYILNAWYYAIGDGERQSVPAGWLSNDNMVISLPEPEVSLAGQTVYVYAEVIPTTRRFHVEGFETVENDPQAFVFRLIGKAGTATANIDVTFTIFDIGYMDIDHLPYGKYTLRTLHWAWRFGHPDTVSFNGELLNAEAGEVTLDLNTVGDVIITYPKDAVDAWLSDAASGVVPLNSISPH